MGKSNHFVEDLVNSLHTVTQRRPTSVHFQVFRDT